MDQDSQDLKQTQEALQKSEARFRSFVENTNDIFWEIDGDGTYTYSSPNISAILGYDASEVIGKTPFAFMPEPEATRIKDLLTVALERGESFLVEHEMLSKDGNIRIMECSGRPIFDNYATIIGYRGVDRDITERKQLEKQLRLSHKMEAVGNLAGGIAHDFNNILTIIAGYTDVLEHGPAPDEAAYCIAGIKRATDRAASMTYRLLAFARRQVMQPEVFNLSVLIEDLTQMLWRVIGEHIQLERRLLREPCLIKADPGQIEQVIVNLVLNARDAMPNGGTLRIETAQTYWDGTSAWKDFPIREGKYVVLQVSDSGIGMSPEVQSRIFEPFFTTKEKGAGLGLATTYGIVKQSGGYIWATSESGAGTTFKVYLPASVDVDSLDEPVSMPSKEARSQMHGKVLLVEDEEEVRQVTRKMLESIGFTVVEAVDGDEAVRLHLEHCETIDVLLTDVVMPRVNGLELASQLKAKCHDMKILFMSGYTQDAVSDYELPSGSASFMRKPFSRDDLEAKMRQVVDA